MGSYRATATHFGFFLKLSIHVSSILVHFCASFGLQDPSGSLRGEILLRNGGLGSQIGGLRPHLDPSWVSVESGPRLSSFESGPRLPSEKSGQVAAAMVTAAAGALAPTGAPASGAMASKRGSTEPDFSDFSVRSDLSVRSDFSVQEGCLE